MKKKLVLFGAGKIAQAITYYFNRDSPYEIVAYCCDKAFIPSPTVFGKPLLDKEEVADRFPPHEHDMFVALGYQNMNAMRAEKVKWARQSGYRLAHYRTPLVPGDYVMGENSMVMDGVAIQPGVTIGDNVLVWGGAMIGHHTHIGHHCWLTGSCAIGGTVRMGASCFVGLNATIANDLTIGERCLLGAGSMVTQSLADGVVLVQRHTEIHRLNIEQFLRISQGFKAQPGEAQPWSD